MTDLSLYTNPDSNDQSPFDSIRRYRADGSEYWCARELMKLLGYTNWRRFGADESDKGRNSVVKKAIAACNNSGYSVDEHFTHLTSRASGSGTIPEDWQFTRYASYLIAQNGDPEKSEIAAAQTYFAIKTRQAELGITKPQQLLPSRELALATAQSVSEIKDLLADTDPRLCQFLVDVAMNDALLTLKAIAPQAVQWLGVVDVAESLGLPVTPSNRVALGKFVKSICVDLGKQESRICNGRTMPIWCYPSGDRTVENAVRQFFN